MDKMYHQFNTRIKYLPKTAPSEEKLSKKIRKINVGNCYVVLNICENGYKVQRMDFNLLENEDKDMFYSEMMKWSLTHTLAKVKGDFFLNLFLVPSKDGQTNITLDILDSIYNRLMDLNHERLYVTLERWEARGIGLSA